MIDPTGRIIALLRDDAAIASMTGGRVRGSGRLPDWQPPFLIVRRLVSVPFPEPGVGVATFRHTALCYGSRVDTEGRADEAEAFRLAGLVADRLREATSNGLLVFPMTGGRSAIYTIQEESTGPALADPRTGEPYVPVTLVSVGSTQVLAPVS